MDENQVQDDTQDEDTPESAKDQQFEDRRQSHPAASRRVRLQQLSEFFQHVPIKAGSEQASAIMAVKEECARLCRMIEERAPHTPEKTLAIRKVQEAAFWATHAISHR